MADSVFLGSVYATAELRTDPFKEGKAVIDRELDSLDSSTKSKLASIGQSFTSAGKMLSIGLTAPLVLFGKQSTNVATDIEFKWKEVEKVYGDTAGAFDRDRKQIEESLDKLSNKFGKSKGDVLDALSVISAIGYEGPKAIDMLTQSIEFATAGAFPNLQSAMEAIVAISSIYGVEGKDLTKVLANINLVENKTAAIIQDLGTAIVTVGSSSISAGVDINELSAYMAVLRKNGTDAGEGANALKTIFTRLRTDDSIEFLSQFGVQVVDTNGKMMEGDKILDAYARLWPKLTDVQKEEAAQATAGVLQKNKFLTLMQDLTRDTSVYRSTLDELASSENAVATYFNEINIFLETNKVKIAQAKQGWQDFQIVVGKILLEIFVPLLINIGKLAKAFTTLDPNIQKVLVIFGIFAALLGPILLIVGQIIVLFGGVAGVLGLTAGALLTAILPFVLIGAAIVALIAILVALWTNWDKIAVFLQTTWSNVVTAVSEKWTAFTTWLAEATDKLVTGIITFFQKLPGAIFQVITDWILRWVEGWGMLVGLVVYGVPKLVDDIVNWFAALPGRLRAIMQDIQNKWNEFLTAVWNFVTDTVPKILSDIVNWFNKLPGKLWKAMVDTKGKAQEGINSVGDAIWEILTEWPGKMYEWGKKILMSFADGINAAIGAIADAFKSGMNKAKAMVEGHSPPIKGPFKDIDKWGYNVGTAWIEGVNLAVSRLQLPDPTASHFSVGQSAPAPINNFKTLSPAFTVNVGVYAGTEVEKRKLAKEFSNALADYERGRGNI